MNLIKRRKNLYKLVRVDSAGRKGGAVMSDGRKASKNGAQYA